MSEYNGNRDREGGYFFQKKKINMAIDDMLHSHMAIDDLLHSEMVYFTN
jgi:hypothetical protein